MTVPGALWDYLIVTASNEAQAAAYEAQLELRRKLGFLSEVRRYRVVSDPGGVRIGSGGSTVYSLMAILNDEHDANPAPSTPGEWKQAFQDLRILIVHAGGDSRRLPPYSPCGKIFVPVPGDTDSALSLTLFDRQFPAFLALPRADANRGQVVVTSGDVLLDFDPAGVRFAPAGITALGCCESPEHASKHGVFCSNPDESVRVFLQKPSPDEQREKGAIDRYGRSILDIGVMSFDAGTSAALLELCGAGPDDAGRIQWSGDVAHEITGHGFDLYREICCALGTEATWDHYIESARGSGSAWSDAALAQVHEALTPIPFRVQVLPHCRFLHFGTLNQIISSGMHLDQQQQVSTRSRASLSINNECPEEGRISGKDSWVEGCRINAGLLLGGENVVVGADVGRELSLPKGACLDVIPGRNRKGNAVWFVRWYLISDDLKGGTLWGLSIMDLPRLSGSRPADVWDSDALEDERTAWNARVFPAESGATAYRQWQWLLRPNEATPDQWDTWRRTDRYSLEEMLALADHEAFHQRRADLRASEIMRSLPHLLRPESAFSATELAHVIANAEDRDAWVSALVDEARRYYLDRASEDGIGALGFSRIIHTIGSALERAAKRDPDGINSALHVLDKRLDDSNRAWLDAIGLPLKDAAGWARRAKQFAFDHVSKTITSTGERLPEVPTNALRKDEIVWGRAAARLDLGGGWSDTPPYTLERGGCVINAAVDLNGQPPIHAYARVIDEPVIRLTSIDFGDRTEVRDFEELMDFRDPTSQFALLKAALAISGLSPDAAPWPRNATLEHVLQEFGGGLELTTLAAIPGGSGLGTSSIMGAVVLAVVQRVMGRTLTRRDLFHEVLRLEQALTTGGGWQDQIGGAVPGVKTITTQPGIVPDPLIHFVPPDLLEPAANEGCTLLYYTGLRRLAKNILQNVVGRYLDRDRAAMATLERIHAFPRRVADAMSRGDLASFGHALAAAWELKKQIDPGSTTDEIEALLDRMQPYVHGVKLMGAGGGGFLLIVCKSHDDAATLRRELESDPPNAQARFFDFRVSKEGLVVSVC